MTLTNYTTRFVEGTTTSTGSVGASETTLGTITLPASVATSKAPIKMVRAWGTVANNVNAKTLTFYFGSTSQAFVLPTSAAASWQLEAFIADITPNSQTCSVRVTTGVIATTTTDTFVLSPTERENSSYIIKITGTATTTNDIVLAAMLVTD